MRYIDLDSGELRPLMTAAPLESETSKRGSAPHYAVQFVRDAVVVELLDTPGTPPVVASVILGFKAKSAFDSVTYVAGPFTAAKSGVGTATVYTFALSFLTAALDQLLATNLDDVDLQPEIKWSSLNENGETLDFTWNIQNNVNRGGESVSTYPITAIAVDLPAVSRLTGGDRATDLDGQALAGFPNATKFDVVTDLTGGGVWGESRWQKRAGSETITDVPGGFIFCTDGTRLYRIDG
jgi:hypothetical protein